jgi:hypothetical protein
LPLPKAATLATDLTPLADGRERGALRIPLPRFNFEACPRPLQIPLQESVKYVRFSHKYQPIPEIPMRNML